MTSRGVELTGGAPWGFRMHGGLDQNQPLRISRSFSESMGRSADVNPGRKASLSGVREGDVITSINGHSTKSMTNSEAHAMLRSAGPCLRLGLNEDKEMSPRRRSIGKATELKRPSQLLADGGKAVLQAPVYATIRPPPQHRPTAPPLRSLSSPPTSVTSASHVAACEPPKIHPTNPFYTTLPSNYTSASRLPVPNGRSTFSSLDRNNSINKSKDSINLYDVKTNHNTDMKKPHSPFETKSVNEVPIIVESNYSDQDYDKVKQQEENENGKNPFETKRNSDPFAKYLRSESQTNGNSNGRMFNSKSDTDFYSKEEITKHSVTEQKISEVEEVKTIKKILLNGSRDEVSNSNSKQGLKKGPELTESGGTARKNEYIITPTLENYNYFTSNSEKQGERLSSSVIYKSPENCYDPVSTRGTGEEPSNDVSSKPPLKSSSSTLTPSPSKQVIDSVLSNDVNHGLKLDPDCINKENDAILEKYKVESPEKSAKYRSKQQKNVKSKSMDSDDQTIIVEVIDDAEEPDCINDLAIIDTSSVLIVENGPETQWENVDDLKDLKSVHGETVPGALSITTIPLSKAECDEIKSMSPEEEKTLRQYIKSLNLSTEAIDSSPSNIKSDSEQINYDIKQRMRKKVMPEEIYNLKAGPSRSLHVIDEEASGESSTNSRRHSYLNEKPCDFDELEDDVFISNDNVRTQTITKTGQKSSGKLIPQKCIRVDAQIKDPEITEARGAWTTKTVEKMTGAEIVYLTDSSSSTSSLYDNNESGDNNEESDVSVRIITPTIEVIDTDNFLTSNITSKSISDCEIVTKKCDVIENKIANDKLCDNRDDHEIVVLTTDLINSDLYVKDVEIMTSQVEQEKVTDHGVETNKDSSSSIGSSQCTAKYNPKCSSLTDIYGTEFDETDKPQDEEICKSHVKDVIESVPNLTSHCVSNTISNVTPSLRNICLEAICKLPYGQQILEELANVSQRLQTIGENRSPIDIKKITTDTLGKDKEWSTKNSSDYKMLPSAQSIKAPPPPVQPRNSSLKITHEDPKNITQSYQEPHENVPYNCLSPSQKMLMEKTNTFNFTETKKHFKELPKEELKFMKPVLTEETLIDVPFKSQTGSRLLALLQKPSLAGNCQEKKCDSNIKLEPSRNVLPSYTKNKDYIGRNENVLQNKSSNSKPIPPPKPKRLLSSFYESDEYSDFLENSFKSVCNQKKYFHYSTGNLNQDIEDDVSHIQDKHRFFNEIYKQTREDLQPRRPSLPKDLCDQQMEYIRQKEKEVEAELSRLEAGHQQLVKRRGGPRAPMLIDEDSRDNVYSSVNELKSSRSYGFLPLSSSSSKLSSAFSKSQEELLRNKMYSEYVCQMAEREERKQKKIIKITKTPCSLSRNSCSKSSSALNIDDFRVNNRIEKEFIDKAKERWNKLGIRDPETEDENEKNYYREPKVIDHKIRVIDSGEEKDVQKLPNHLQDFVKFTAKNKSDKTDSSGESESRETSHGVVLCAVFILILTIAKHILRLFRRQ
ncbi:unnamed protein product [Leptosia nina]|uniref:PDZ domain-containing protein n=1 Tax=Leptosia nina TaxID=320188 RepID=A0AAV1J9J1_9NEOP